MKAQLSTLAPVKSPELPAAATEASQMQVLSLIWSMRALDGLQRKTPGNLPVERDPISGLSPTSFIQRDLKALGICAKSDQIYDLVGMLPETSGHLSNINECATDRTITVLGQVCNLTHAEREILRFVASMTLNWEFNYFMDFYFNKLNFRSFVTLLSEIFQTSIEEVRSALDPAAFLRSTGLIHIETRTRHRMGKTVGDIVSMSESVLNKLEIAEGNFDVLTRLAASVAPARGLEPNDFGYMRKEWHLALSYLKGSLKGGHEGANILLHGAPGLGKTEFARTLARAAGVTAFEVISISPDGGVCNHSERRDSYFLARKLLARNTTAVIVFDDADESLGQSGAFRRESSASKAGINSMLEKTPIPTIWILNDTSNIEPAVMRRFDISIGLVRPPSHVIRQQLNTALSTHVVSEGWLRHVSKSKAVTPAVVGRIGRLADRVASDCELEEMLSTSLENVGIKTTGPRQQIFNRKFCNTTPDIADICRFVKNSSTSKLLLYGPTATGKTLMSKHLAEVAGLQPKLIRPSDILGSFVGETEANIATLFGRTDPNNELIILDEFESLAEDRRGAQRGWEISKVAEMLSQFDDYDGRVIACTNLLENVDPAIRRRFSMKAHVLGLSNTQRLAVIREFALKLKIKFPDCNCSNFQHLDGLAYGHVKNAATVAGYMEHLDWSKFLQLIHAELISTGGELKRGIGFVAGGLS